MSITSLQEEAKTHLKQIAARFTAGLRGRRAQFPLRDLLACRLLDHSVSATMDEIRRATPPRFPIALVLAMLEACRALEAMPSTASSDVMPRLLAHEVAERLQAELPATHAFALDQISRIVDEASTLSDLSNLHNAVTRYRARLAGAASSRDLHVLVEQVWRQRYPHLPEALKLADAA
jgi:hypothetical protein